MRLHSAAIRADRDAHQVRMSHLLEQQRHLLTFVNRSTRPPGASPELGNVARGNLAAMLRVIELDGGALPVVSLSDLEVARAHVEACHEVALRADDGTDRKLLPFDRGFAERARRFHRAEEHLLDELLELLFEKPGEPWLVAEREKALLYRILWTAMHALDAARTVGPTTSPPPGPSPTIDQE